MFENLLFQNITYQLMDDIKNSKLPSSILFSGPQSSGKLTCALEIARVLSCRGDTDGVRGKWLCNCASCKKQRELSSTNLIVTGPRDCSLEILAATKNLLESVENNAAYLQASRMLFIRAVRKMLLRFSPVLWEGDKALSSLSSYVEEINEQLELLNPELSLPPLESLEKITKKIIAACAKLESTYMYSSLPIDHIRKASFWAHLKTNEGIKVLIIENADRMNENSRNALLKILEEPPEETLFILTTTRRNAVMPTILSRVRTYNFVERNESQQAQVIQRVFHDDPEKGSNNVSEYLQTFLPVTPSQIKKNAADFYNGIKENHLLQIGEIVKNCNNFEPRSLFNLFLNGIIEAQKNPVDEANVSGRNPEVEFKNLEAIRDCYNNLTVYNLSAVSALENLYRDLASIRKLSLR